MMLVLDKNGHGIDADGTRQRDLRQAELYQTDAQARAVAAKFGGRIEDESRIFGDDMDDEE